MFVDEDRRVESGADATEGRVKCRRHSVLGNIFIVVSMSVMDHVSTLKIKVNVD